MIKCTKKQGWITIIGLALILGLIFTCVGCVGDNQQNRDGRLVNKQDTQYGAKQPVPFFDYSIPRDVLIQIYNVVTTEARNTYTVIQSMTGAVVAYGPSVGYAIPADTQLTNPLSLAGVEQPEPNGLFSSKNTDGTWVLFVESNGDVTPIYTEQKVTTYPYPVVQNAAGVWVRADNSAPSTTINIKKK